MIYSCGSDQVEWLEEWRRSISFPIIIVANVCFLLKTRDPLEPEWSTWSQWAPCSRTCDGGATYQTRRCLDNIRGCGAGRSIRYQICNMQVNYYITRNRERESDTAPIFIDWRLWGRIWRALYNRLPPLRGERRRRDQQHSEMRCMCEKATPLLSIVARRFTHLSKHSTSSITWW